MPPRRKKRLFMAAFIVTGVGLAVGLTLSALKQNINLFYSPSQVVAGEAPSGRSFRIGGMVVNGSVQRNTHDLEVQFALTDTADTVPVTYTGILPDLFREGQGIVALGRIENGRFRASEVLAKHDENYMSPEVSEALKAAGAKQFGGNQTQ